MRRVILKRFALSTLAFGLTWLYVWGLHRYDTQSWIVAAARRWGCQVAFESRVIMWGPEGPFAGDDPRNRLGNWFARNGPLQAAVWSGFIAAAAAYGLLARGYRWRPLGYRGPTRCGACGYGLSGLRDPRCPECGRTI